MYGGVEGEESRGSPLSRFDAFSGGEMNEAERRQRLVGWLEVIFADVQDLLLDDHIFWALQEVVAANPRFKNTPGLFTQWMVSSFIQATAVGVRRQAKGGDDSVSLKRFLLEVQTYPGLVSRAHYISLFANSEAWLREAGERDFDRVAGAGALHLPTAVIAKQLVELETAVKGIEHYVDRRVAHYDQRGLAQPTPTLAELTESLHTLERLVKFYWVFLKGHSMTTMLPTIQFDWQAIFRFQWSAADMGDSGEVF
jgi:hypothetical protein